MTHLLRRATLLACALIGTVGLLSVPACKGKGSSADLKKEGVWAGSEQPAGDFNAQKKSKAPMGDPSQPGGIKSGFTPKSGSPKGG